MHRFYSKSKEQQNRILLLSALLIFIPVFALILFSAYFRLYGLIVLAGLIFSTFICFIDVPAGERNGVFIYHSPLLFTTKEKNRIIEIHGGTLFDYFFTLDPRQSKAERKRIIIRYYLDGLLNIIKHYEAVEDEDLQITATSYIINDRTAARMGFIKAKPDYIQSLTVLLNYLPILCAYSYSQAGLGFPNISGIKTFKTSLKDLKNKKEEIRQLKERMNKAVMDSKTFKAFPISLPCKTAEARENQLKDTNIIRHSGSQRRIKIFSKKK